MLNGQDVANVLWAFAKTGHRNTVLLEAFGDAISSWPSGLLPSQAAETSSYSAWIPPSPSTSSSNSPSSWPDSSAQPPAPLTATGAKVMPPQRPGPLPGAFRPQELSVILWAYATLRYTHEVRIIPEHFECALLSRSPLPQSSKLSHVLPHECRAFSGLRCISSRRGRCSCPLSH